MRYLKVLYIKCYFPYFFFLFFVCYFVLVLVILVVFVVVVLVLVVLVVLVNLLLLHIRRLTVKKDKSSVMKTKMRSRCSLKMLLSLCFLISGALILIFTGIGLTEKIFSFFFLFWGHNHEKQHKINK